MEVDARKAKRPYKKRKDVEGRRENDETAA